MLISFKISIKKTGRLCPRCFQMVRVAGLEPTTSCTPSKRSTKLSYTLNA